LGELQHEIVVSATSGPTKKQGEGMPLIQVKLIEGVFNRKQKAEIVKKLTDAMVSIQGGLRRCAAVNGVLAASQ
jgi:hypothetical protein